MTATMTDDMTPVTTSVVPTIVNVAAIKQRPDPAARLKADTADLNRARNDIDKERRKIAEAEDRIAYLLEDVRVLELYVKAHEKAVGYQTKGTE